MLFDEKLYFGELVDFAMIYGEDPSTRNAALILPNHDGGFRLPRMDVNRMIDPEFRKHLDDRTQKLKYIEHAERGVLYRAARQGIATRDREMVVLWAPCPDCARGIVLSGIRCVRTLADDVLKAPDRWRDAIETGREILRVGGVRVAFYTPNLGKKLLFDGKEIDV